MKVTYNWLKDFVDIKIPAQELAQKLTMAGLEVTSLENKGADVVLELEITSNRPDCLSVIGIAREVAAITGKKLKLSTRYSPLVAGHSSLNIKIENKKDCPLYTARVIKGIKVKPSPDWLKARLESIGLRSVNNIVDITNYVLMETGQPLHAFDLDKIKNNTIFVRRGKATEKMVTIDGQQRNLSRDILVIADKEKAVAIAGVMGGLDSEVNQKTSSILLESAIFDPIITRRASRNLGLSSESAYRFERGIDVWGVDFASARAAKLISQLTGGKLVLSKSTTKPKVKKKSIVLTTEQVNRVLGEDVSVGQIKKILTGLCFTAKRQKAKDLKIDVPSFRSDVSQPVDLIEEVARISDYENIPVRLPRMMPQAQVSLAWAKRRSIKDILVSQGMDEVITYSLISKTRAHEFGYPDTGLISIANPLTSEQGVLRPGIIPGLVDCIGYNLNQKQKDIRIFEIGNVFANKQESAYLALAWSGTESNLLHIKGILTLLLERLGIIDFEFTRPDAGYPCFQKGSALSLIVGKKLCANLGIIKADILERLDIKESVSVVELNLEILFAKIKKTDKKYSPLPLYPEVVRDISIMIKQDIPIGDVIKAIKTSNAPYLIELNVKDCYSGKQIASGFKGLTLSCIYQAPDHTLTAQEIENSHQKVINILKLEFSAQQR